MKATLSIHQLYAGSTLRQAHPLRGRSAPAAGGAWCLLRLLNFYIFARKNYDVKRLS